MAPTEPWCHEWHPASMPRFIAILEDDPRRIAEMGRILADVLPAHEVVVFATAPTMVHWLSVVYRPSSCTMPPCPA